MSPLTEESAKILTDSLLELLGNSQQQQMKLRALEQTLEKDFPAAFERYQMMLRALQEHNDATRAILQMERLKQLLQK